jgi:DNA-binding GntR family transcriptional regulator
VTARRSTTSASIPTARPTPKPVPYERIKNAIITGEFVPGQPVIESELAEWCAVSRTPIREALTRLKQDGLLIRTDRGLVVRERSPEEILDIYETRILLEAAAARAAAACRSLLDVVQIRLGAHEFANIDPANERAMAEANRGFHRAIWKASHNESLTDVLDRLGSHLSRYPMATLSRPGRWAEANAEHMAILAAIENQEVQLAHDLSAKHFTRARDIRLELWAQGLR